jgi:hypothetical protein
MLLLLACTGESPFKPENATVNLTLQNSGGHSDPSTITDTVGNRVRINLIGYLPSYIDSVKVVIGISTTTDTDFTFPKTTSWTDSQWIEIVFHSPGTRTVTATVFVEGKAKPVTATIVVVGRLVNHAPALDVSGVRNITTTQACSLSLSTRDIDSGQTFTYAMIKAPQNATLAANIFKWTPPTGHTGTDTVKFTVTDNGKPPMSDTQTVFITVSLQITVPVKVQGVKAASKINGYFVFSWSKVSNADSYDVFRSADMVNFQKIGSSSDSLFGDSVKTANFYYYVVAVNSAGPSPASAMVYSGSIKTPPVIMVLADTSVAQGKTLAFMVQYVASAQDTVTLGATDISGGKLPDSATFDSRTGLFTWTPTFSELGLYKIIFTATNGNAVGKDTVKITVNKTDRAPVVQAQSVNTGRDAAITITLIANDPDNDAITQWRLPTAARHGTATLANPAIGSVVYTPNAGFIGVDTFAVDAYDGSLWSMAPANVIVTVDSSKIAPKIQTQPRPDTTVNQGGSVTFTVTINNAFPTPAFTWYKGTKGSGASVQSGTNSSYQKTGVAAADSGNYYVIVVNASGSDTSAYAHLTVNRPPVANDQNISTNRNTAKAITLTASDPDGNPLSNWNIVSNPIHGSLSGIAPNVSYTPTTNFAGADSFAFNVSDNAPLVSNTAKVKITVVDVAVAPVIQNQPGNLTKDKGLSASFLVSINADANPAPTYQWQKNGTNIPAATNATAATATLTINPVNYSDQGNYRVAVSNSAGSDTSNSATLTVRDITPPTIILKGAADTIALNSVWVDPGDSVWDDRDGVITSSVVAGGTVNALTIGKYTKTYNVSDAAGNAAVQMTRVVRVEGWELINSSLSAKYVQMVINPNNVLYMAYIDASDNLVRVKQLNGTTWVSMGGTVNSAQTYDMSFALAPDGVTPCVGYIQDNSGDYSTYFAKLSAGVWSNNFVNLGYPGFFDIGIAADNTPWGVLNNAVMKQRTDGSGVWDTMITTAGPFWGFSGMGASYRHVHVMGFTSTAHYNSYPGNSMVNFIVKKRSGNSWIPAGSDSTVGSWNGPPFQMAFSPNRVFAAAPHGANQADPYVYELIGTNWTQLGVPIPPVSPATEYGTYGFSLAAATSDGTPYLAYKNGNSSNAAIYVKKYNGTNWEGVPAKTTDPVVAQGASHIFMVVGNNICYLSIIDDSGVLKLYRYQKQL